jgi:hypothetical protein
MFHFHRNSKARHSERVHIAPRFNTVLHRNTHWKWAVRAFLRIEPVLFTLHSTDWAGAWWKSFQQILLLWACGMMLNTGILWMFPQSCGNNDSKLWRLSKYQTQKPSDSPNHCAPLHRPEQSCDAEKSTQQLGLRKRPRGSWRICLHRRIKPQLSEVERPWR